VVLAPDDALVAYTDGVVEEREGDEFFGEGRLREVLASCDGVPAADIAERIVRAVEAFRPDPPADDIAVLAMRAIPIERRAVA
jgi:serine phosphatase RsbU (regulator of sigma subunit)